MKSRSHILAFADSSLLYACTAGWGSSFVDSRSKRSHFRYGELLVGLSPLARHKHKGARIVDYESARNSPSLATFSVPSDAMRAGFITATESESVLENHTGLHAYNLPAVI